MNTKRQIAIILCMATLYVGMLFYITHGIHEQIHEIEKNLSSQESTIAKMAISPTVTPTPILIPSSVPAPAFGVAIPELENNEPIIVEPDIPCQFVDRPLPAEYQEYLWYLCDAYGIDFYFMMGLIEFESNYEVDVISPTNDYGLCQINTCNHKWLSEALGITDFLDPYQNMLCGVYMIADLARQYEDAHLVLMAYNMGSKPAEELWIHGTWSTAYSRNVMKRVIVLQDEYCGNEFDMK